MISVFRQILESIPVNQTYKFSTKSISQANLMSWPNMFSAPEQRTNILCSSRERFPQDCECFHFLCVHQMCTYVCRCMCIYGWIFMWKPEDNLRSHLPCVLREGLSLVWNWPIRLGWPASDLRARITSTCHRVWLILGGCWRWNFGPCACKEDSLWMEPPP